MKNTKKILSWVLALAMMMSTFIALPVSAASSPVTVYVSADGVGPNGETAYTTVKDAVEANKTESKLTVYVCGTVEMKAMLDIYGNDGYTTTELNVLGYDDDATLIAKAIPNSSIYTSYIRLHKNNLVVNVKDLTFDINGFSWNGGHGFIYIHYCTTATANLENVRFTNSKPGISSASTYAANICGTMNFKNCTFENHNCTHDKGLIWGCGLGNAHANFSFKECTFINNVSTKYASAISLEDAGNVVIEDCTIVGNDLTGYGVSNENVFGTLSIENLKFQGAGQTFKTEIRRQYDNLMDVTYVSEIAEENGLHVYSDDGVDVITGADSTLPFSYWKDQNGSIYPAGSKVNAQGVILTAVYGAAAPTDSYTLTYKNTAASSDNETVTSAAADNNVLTVKAASDVTDKKFLYWTDGTRNYQAGESIQLTKNTTLTAVYYNYYKLTYVNDYVTSESETVSSLDNSFTVKAGTADAENDDGDRVFFYGWSDGKTIYQENNVLQLTEDTTLTAVYDDIWESIQMKNGLFDTVQEAIDAVPAGQKTTITLDKSYTEDITIPADKDIIIKGTADTVITGAMTVNGAFELQGATLLCSTTNGNTITANEGSKVVITSGSIGLVDSSYRSTAIYNNGGEVIVNGGTLASYTSSKTGTARTLANNAGTTTVNGGTITANYIPVSVTGGTMTIKNGVFYNTQPIVIMKSSQYLLSVADGTLNIKGGAFDATDARNPKILDATGTVNVYKGYFSETDTIASYLVDGRVISDTATVISGVSYPYSVQSTIALPEDAATLDIIAKDGGYYTGVRGGQTGVLRYISKINYKPEYTLESVGTKFIPLSIFEDEEADKTWADVNYTNVADFASGDTFAADLKEIEDTDFENDYVALSYATFEGYAGSVVSATTTENATNSVADARDLGAARELVCDEDGNFRILIVSDPQYDSSDSTEWIAAGEKLRELVDESDPDFVFFDGDISDVNMPETGFDVMVECLVEYGIPFATVNGNHDQPFKEANYNLFTSYSLCMNDRVDASDPNYESSRPMNYALPIYANDGETQVFTIYGMDSGGSRYGEYDGVTENQVNWYKAKADEIKKLNGGKTIPAVLCVHIPLTEFTAAEYITGYVGSIVSITGDCNNFGLYDAIVEKGDVKITVHGHDHDNNYITKSKDGILMSFAGKLAHGAYGNEAARGGRIIEFNQADPENFITYWIATDGGADQVAVNADGTFVK